jgi:hypothetical protein
MKRWRRFVLPWLTVLLIVVWTRSHLPPTLQVRSLDGKLMLFFSDGKLTFVDPDAPEYRGKDTMMTLILGDPQHEFRLLGFAYVHGLWPRPTNPTSGGFSLRPFTLVELPYWVPTLAVGVPAVVAMLRRRRSAKWKLAGRCEDCGFDIRFNKDRCPECGKAIPSPVGTSDGMSATSR